MSSAAAIAASPLVEALHEVAASVQQVTVRVMEGRRSIGSGVIWGNEGVIVTNSHVMRGPSATIEDSSGRRLTAQVEKRDAKRDLVALRVPDTWKHAAVPAPTSSIRTGDVVMALGSPFGVPNAVVTGIVHAIGPVEDMEAQSWIQADIRLAPGNSGGPLADVRGRVIGINSMIARGLGLAVPADSVSLFLAGKSDQPTIGVSVQAVAVKHSGSGGGRLGLYVEDVDPNGAAGHAGIRRGDILIGYRERPFRKPADLLVALRSGGPRVRLDVLRGGQQIPIEVNPEQ